jgi:4-amino-4-deoxy-L-arabinose transferase-like glycosyltransferase
MGTTLPIPLAPPRRPTLQALPQPHPSPTPSPAPRWPIAHLALILGLWLAIFAAALVRPPLLDDADATHAQAAQAMLRTGDFTTLQVDGIRYLEKPPLPYWISALSLRLFASAGPSAGARSAFAIHFPLALTVLGLALLGYAWSRRAFDSNPAASALPNRTALYTALFVLTSAGVFLFTRIFIPDALLSLLLAFTLFAMLRTLEPSPEPSLEPAPHSGAPSSRSFTALRWAGMWPYAMWTALALAVLTKGLVALVFFFGTAFIFLLSTGERATLRQNLHRLHPVTGFLLFLAIAAPWHILAGLRNTGGANGHGFFWFYFVNEHFLRFLGRRIPRDYNKLPGYLYWSLHLVWLFPWSLFAPAAILYAWRRRSTFLPHRLHPATPLATASTLAPTSIPPTKLSSRPGQDGFIVLRSGETCSSFAAASTFTHRTVLLLSIFTALVLVFFSLSTNQEYYTFPVYLPLLMLLAAALAAIDSSHSAAHLAHQPVILREEPRSRSAAHLAHQAGILSEGTRDTLRGPQPNDPVAADPATTARTFSTSNSVANSLQRGDSFHRALTFSFAALTLLGLCIAAALGYGLWTARHLPFVADIGSLLAHRDVGGYTLSMSHFFDLTGPSFAALRLPATLAAVAFLFGPAIAWILYARRASEFRTPAYPQPRSLLFAPILTLALTSALFLIAAHLALERFAPLLSSETFATTIQSLERSGRIAPDSQVLIYGDQAFGSSIPFYLAQDDLAQDDLAQDDLPQDHLPQNDLPQDHLPQNDLPQDLLPQNYLAPGYLANDHLAPAAANLPQRPAYLANDHLAPAAANLSQRPAYLAPHAATPRVFLVDGRTTSMLFGSTFPDAPPIFLTHQQLLAQWGHGPRKLLFVPLEQRGTVDHLLGPHQFLLQETSGKALLTDRPLNPTP